MTADVTQALSNALKGRADVELAILFGSEARGESGPDSDVDVAVLAPSVNRLELAAQLGDAVGREVQVVSLEDATIPLVMQIVRDGAVVHEGVSGAHARWRTRALLALETDGPWYARMRDAWLNRVAARGV